MKNLTVILAQRAFSLIEMAMVVAVSGLMVGYVLQANLASAPDCNTATKQQLQKIAEALDAYPIAHNRMPFPAMRNVGVEDPNYGREAAVGQLDTTGSVPNRLIYGALPFQALGLPDSYGGDCWGNKFTYVIAEKLTNAALMGGYPDVAIQGIIPVQSGAGNLIMSNAAWAVISHGADGYGGVKLNYAGAAHGWCSGTATIEAWNCGLNGIVKDAVFNDGKNATNNLYDDIIVYHARLMKGGVPVAGQCGVRADGPGACAVGYQSIFNNHSYANCTIDTWDCLGSSGGATAHCTYNNPCAGSCSASLNTCAVGGVSHTHDNGCGSTRTWQCDGTWGGSDVSCAYTNPVCATCNASPNVCNDGTTSGYADTGCNGYKTWTCTGYGGQTVGCSITNVPCPINGSCGGGANTCGAGYASGYSDSGCGGAQTWGCYGYYGGSNVGCSIANSPCPINGGWGGFGGCSQPCGTGVQYRNCDSPTPAYGGAGCPGANYQYCNTQSCTVPVTGQCGGSLNSCIQGNPINGYEGDCRNNDTWTCQGADGGSDTACSVPDPKGYYCLTGAQSNMDRLCGMGWSCDINDYMYRGWWTQWDPGLFNSPTDLTNADHSTTCGCVENGMSGFCAPPGWYDGSGYCVGFHWAY